MKSFQTNIFTSFCVDEGQSLELIDVFDIAWKKIIELYPHSALTYLIIGLSPDIDIQIVTKWPYCSCKIFWLFASDVTHPVAGSIKVLLQHSQTSAEVELISFLRDGATISIDGALDIGDHLDHVHGRLLEQNIVLWKDISIKTLPKLNIASHNVRASHGANIDMLDQQKLFYMMSRGLTSKQSQTLLVDWYIEYVLSNFSEISDAEKKSVYKKIK